MTEFWVGDMTFRDWFVLAFLAHSPGVFGRPGQTASRPGAADFRIGERLAAPWSPLEKESPSTRRWVLRQLVGLGFLEVLPRGVYRATPEGIAALDGRRERLYCYYVEYGTKRRKIPALAFAYVPPQNIGKNWTFCGWGTRPMADLPKNR